MFINIEPLTGDAQEVNFENENKNVILCGFTRPTHLPLIRESSFSPILLPTPELLPDRDCNLAEKRDHCVSNKTNFEKRVPSGPIASKSSILTSGDRSGPKQRKGFNWIRSRWRKLKKKPRDDNTVNYGTISHGSLKGLSRSPIRPRAATAPLVSICGKENKRDWGEERHDDVIYTVTLKRIRKTASPAHDKTDGLQWETQKVRSIKGATLPFLARRLCHFFTDDVGEQNFLTVFLATYRSFATPAQVLDLIIAECEKLKEEPHEKQRTTLSSIVRILKTWIETYFDEDFYDPPDHPLLKKMQFLAEKYHQDESLVCQINAPAIENECGFINFIKSKLKAAEEKESQEEVIKSTRSPFYFNIHDETQDIEFEKDINLTAAKRFLSDFSTQQIAEQLTLKDANLFLRVVPFHCLKAVRSSKQKPASVKATIDQFNHIVYCVLGTCLCPLLKTSLRAKILCKWIEVAQECRELKNFSSLRAVVSGLQTHSIHRLKRTWQHIPNNLNDLLKELGQLNMKDLIKKVGTAKVNTEKSAISKVRKDASTRRQQAIHQGIMHGTVPYLGSFLTDLTYLHTAKPDFLEEGKRLINFNKRRMEFELLAQLQLWQASCHSYQPLKPDPAFSAWLSSIVLPSDEQAIQLSDDIEPPNTVPPSPISTPVKWNVERFACQNGGLESSGSSSTSLPVNHARNSSNELVELKLPVSENTTTRDGQTTAEASNDKGRTINVQVIKKVNNASEDIEIKKLKEMKLSSNDRSPAFKKKAFNLFELEEENMLNFTLVQILPNDKELLIPETANVFYAMNSSTEDYNFVLLEDGAELPRGKRENNVQSTLLSQKPKWHQRKATTSTSSAAAASPIKTIYRHLGMSGLSLSSGFYSPSKETVKTEKAPEEKTDSDDFRMFSEQKAGKGDNDSKSAINRYSENSNEETDRSRKQKVWKAFSWSKGHKRNFSDYDHVERSVSENAASQISAGQLIYSINDTIIFPLSTPEHPDVSIPGEENDDRSWTSSVSDPGYGISTSSTWPRDFDFSIFESQKFHRQAAIRKHNSHPRDAGSNGTLPELQIAARREKTRPELKSILKSERKTGFHSKFSSKNSENKSKTFSRTFSREQIKPLQAGKDEDTFSKSPTKHKTRNFARAASDPLILRLSGNEAFNESSNHPIITVQCPTPKELVRPNDFEPKTVSGLSPSGEPKPRMRLSSETKTTFL